MEDDLEQIWDLSPVAIGGVGGSGTRLIAEMLAKLGFYIGDDLNKANDNLWFTLLFKRAGLLALDENREQLDRAMRIFLSAMTTRRPLSRDERALLEDLASTDRLQHGAPWLGKRAESLVLDIGKQMGDRFLLLNYDDFCSEPEKGLRSFLPFLDVERSSIQELALREEVQPPASIGRFKHHGLHVFDPGDVEFVESLGFDVSER